MDFKKFWKESFGGFLLKRILLAVLIVVTLSVIALFVIDKYTRHGEFEIVPDMKGMYVEEAQLILSNQSLYPQVIDSMYDRTKKLGTIIEQTPAPGSSIKRNRPVYIIINSRQVRQVPLPNVNDVSYRQADAMLKAIGLNISNVEYSPSEYKDLVINVKYRGRVIESGTRIPEGSFLVLVVGSGMGGETVSVPLLKGFSIDEARREAIAASVIVGATQYDVQPNGDEADYVIYRQRPKAGREVEAGQRIDVWLSKDKSLLNKTFEEDEAQEGEDERFF